jgi:peptide-methionine (S)-S-oxide reductase
MESNPRPTASASVDPPRPWRPLRRIAGTVMAFAAAIAALVVAVPLIPALRAAEPGVEIPAPTEDLPPAAGASSQRAIFAGGCFWGVQGVFQHLQGVSRVVAGYSGGTAETAKYDLVSGGRTRHAESVEITYDPSRISYGKLLQVFFSVAHDPTQLDRQGPDHGPQYRSAIFAATPEQARIARAYIAQLDQAKAYPSRIVTTVDDQPSFFMAEAYHQDFMTEHPSHPYIVVHDLPKIDELKRLFGDRYRADPVLVKRAQSAG